MFHIFQTLPSAPVITDTLVISWFLQLAVKENLDTHLFSHFLSVLWLVSASTLFDRFCSAYNNTNHDMSIDCIWNSQRIFLLRITLLNILIIFNSFSFIIIAFCFDGRDLLK